MGTDWALFDPQRGYPANTLPPPQVFERYATYMAGNRRILEFNAVSQSVRISSTPQVLEARAVEYTKVGPRLVEIKKKGRAKGGAETVDAVARRAAEMSRRLQPQEQRLEHESEESEVDTSQGSEVEVKVEMNLE